MYLSLSVSSLSAGLLVFAVALLAGRNPKTPVWAGETSMSIIICPLIVSLVALGGIGCLYTIFAFETLAMTDILIACGIATGSIILYLLLGIPKKLRAFAASDKAGEVIPGDFRQQGDTQGPPADEARFPKAA